MGSSYGETLNYWQEINREYEKSLARKPGSFQPGVSYRGAEPELPEPAFFGPPGAGAVKLLRLRTKLQKWLFNCRKYVECKLGRKCVRRCRKYVGNM